MNKLIFLTALVFLSSCSNQARQNERTIEYLRDNYSYDWARIRANNGLLQFSEQFYKTELEGEDQLVFERAYLVTFDETDYAVIEFDFKEALDSRLLFVFNNQNGDFIGYFKRSLA